MQIIPDSQWPTTAHNRVLEVRDALEEFERPVTVQAILRAMAKAGSPQSDRTVRRILWLLWELDVVSLSGDENRRLWQLQISTNTNQET